MEWAVDYRTTLQHYTRLELVDAEGAIGEMASVSSDSGATSVLEAPDPQRIPQQSAHDGAQPLAT